VFDDEARNTGWRHQRLPDYKAGRAPMPDDLHAEMPMLRAAFEQRGVPAGAHRAMKPTIWRHACRKGGERRTSGHDRFNGQRLLPAALPTIRIRDYFQKRWLDAPFIASEFGVSPEQLPDYWGLAGISSSKVPGVAGIGPKSAAQLLTDFQSLEGFTPVWMTCQKNGARSWRRIKRWRLSAGKSQRYRRIYSWTGIYSSCG
jgi:protein Xni